MVCIMVWLWCLQLCRERRSPNNIRSPNTIIKCPPKPKTTELKDFFGVWAMSWLEEVRRVTSFWWERSNQWMLISRTPVRVLSAKLELYIANKWNWPLRHEHQENNIISNVDNNSRQKNSQSYDGIYLFTWKHIVYCVFPTISKGWWWKAGTACRQQWTST